MSNLGNKETMSRNLRYYLQQSRKTQKEICEAIGVNTSTFNDWVKGRKYPRIDKIERMAEYFGILKSSLIENRETMEQKNDALTDIVIRLRGDDEFTAAVADLYKLDKDKLLTVRMMLKALL